MPQNYFSFRNPTSYYRRDLTTFPNPVLLFSPSLCYSPLSPSSWYAHRFACVSSSFPCLGPASHNRHLILRASSLPPGLRRRICPTILPVPGTQTQDRETACARVFFCRHPHLCSTADPTASPGLVLGWIILTFCLVLSFSRTVPSHLQSSHRLTGLCTCHYTSPNSSPFSRHPPPCFLHFSSLSTATLEGSSYHQLLHIPNTWKPSHSPGGFSFRLRHTAHLPVACRLPFLSVLSILSMATASPWSLLYSSPRS